MPGCFGLKRNGNVWVAIKNFIERIVVKNTPNFVRKIGVEKKKSGKEKKIGVEKSNKETEKSIGTDGAKIETVHFMIIPLMMIFGRRMFMVMIRSFGMSKKSFGRM